MADEPEVNPEDNGAHVEAQLVVGTGTPPTSPNFGVPRYSSADPADFPTQGNAITDTFDAKAARRGAIVDADIAAGAAIAGTKLAPIVDATVSPTAAIQESKLALATDAAPAVGSRRTLGRGANQAMAGNDTRAGGSAGTALPILDVGVLNQIRAGRQLTASDFTTLGLSAPLGLWNLSDLSDASGNGRALTNKGAVPFGPGINGQASTAAVFAGSTAQALYISDTGASDPFRIRTGSWGCWFRTAKRGANQACLFKYSAAVRAYTMGVQGTNLLGVDVGTAGDGSAQGVTLGVSDVADDRWHFGVATFDGAAVRLYVDGVLEATATAPGTINAATGGPLNIGGFGADGSTAAGNPFYGRVDEAFVTNDVLSDDQIRALYCAKIPHGFNVTPTVINLAVRRARKGGPLAVADFPTQPLRLHNFTAGALTDQGANNVALTNSGAAVSVVGADGAQAGAFNFVAASSQSLSATDAGLPSGLAARSYGGWFKTTAGTVGQNIEAWGTLATGDGRLYSTATGLIASASGGDSFSGPFVADGQWHHAVVTEDNAAGDGVKRKLYLDGRLVGGSTVMNSIALLGANHFRVGSDTTGTGLFTGQIDGVFVLGVALTQDQISTLYAKGSQALPPSVKNSGDHVEFADSAAIYATFDTLDTQHAIDLSVSG